MTMARTKCLLAILFWYIFRLCNNITVLNTNSGNSETITVTIASFVFVTEPKNVRKNDTFT